MIKKLEIPPPPPPTPKKKKKKTYKQILLIAFNRPRTFF